MNETLIKANGLSLPYTAYGTGVVGHYSTNFKLMANYKLRLMLSSIKHRYIHRQLVIDFCSPKLVRAAYNNGVRFFDTGRIYGKSELAIGQGLKGIERSSYTICTKISDLNLLQEHTPNDCIGNLKLSLKYLRTNFIDLWLLHHPHGPWLDMWKEMEKARKIGLVKAIGVSNFSVDDFVKLERIAESMPMVCQNERHPLFLNKEVFDYCKTNKILFMAHTPTAGRRKELTYNPAIVDLCNKYKKTVRQVIMRWHYQHGVVPVFSTSKRKHIRDNIDIFGFALTDKEVCSIDSLDVNLRLLDCLDGVDNPLYVYNL